MGLTCLQLPVFILTLFLKANNMTKFLSALAGLTILSTSFTAHANDLLTGDTRLACEAILCLSTGSRPSECSPSIKRYFSINHKKISDTIKDRKNFLNLCPTANAEGMPALVNAIANGAGRCDAAELNRVNTQTITIPNPVFGKGGSCYQRWGMKSCDKYPKTITKTIINNKKPSYCEAYFSHGWTQIGTKYQGDPSTGGKWVD